MQRRRKTAAATGAIALAIIAICAACNRDGKQFEAAKQAGTVDAYKEFVAQYPNSQWAAEAQKEIARLTEKADYEAAVAANSAKGYKAFRARYPDSARTAEVTAAMEALLGKMIQGRIARELRGWTVEGRMLVEVPVPLAATGAMALAKYELRSDDKPLARCVGLVPPAKFSGGVTGLVDEERTAAPLPVANFRPAAAVQPARGSTNVEVRDFYFPVGYKDSLLVGEGLTIAPADKEGFAVAASGTTFLLLGDGFHVRAQRVAGSRTAGFKVPLKDEVSLLFAVEPIQDPFVQVVGEDGVSRDVRLAQATATTATK